MKAKLLLLLLLANFSINAQTNLVQNGDFETWSSSNLPSNWFLYFSGYVSKSTIAQNGASSVNMMIASGTSNFINTDYFPVTAGKTYRVTLYHRLAKGTFTSIELSLYHKPSTFKEEIIKKSDATFSTTEWRKLEFEYTPTVTENIELDIWTYGSLNSEILVDNVSIVDVKDIPLQYTKIPDVEFEKKLISLGLDSGATDGQVLTSNIKTVKSLTLDTRVISDLTGIQDFTALETLVAKGATYLYPTAESDGILKTLDVSKNINLLSLDCSVNKLTSLDISNNPKLNYLNCGENKITSINTANNPNLWLLSVDSNLITTIDISKNQNITSFSCAYTKVTSFDLGKNPGLILINVSGNKLTTLDVSKNTSLVTLYCYGNSFTTIDISKNSNLVNLDCSNNPLTSLDLSNNIALQTLLFTDTTLPTLDVSKNINLRSIDCGSKELTTIDLSNNLNLQRFAGSHGQFKTLDFSKNVNLTTVYCQFNPVLGEINLKNGNNTKITGINLTGNPSLYCIQVDDVNYSTLNWKQKDAYVNYTATCSAPTYTAIPDKEFEKRLIELGIDSGTADGRVLTSRIATVKSLKVDPMLVADLTGLEDFTALEALHCGSGCVSTSGGGCGKITKLDVSKNTALAQLSCDGNQIASLDVSKNTKLNYLNCSTNLLTSLDISNNTELSIVNIYRNYLIEINLSNNKKVSELNCFNNKLKNLDVTNSKLTSLNCSNNEISSLDLSNQSGLIQLYVDNNKLTTLNTTNKPNLVYFNCSRNLLTDIDVTSSTSLVEYKCSSNKLTNLNVTKNINLTSLACGTNTISGFDISKNLKLRELECSELQLNTLDVTFLPELGKLTANKNNLTAIDLSKNSKLTDLYLVENQITEIDVTKNPALVYLIVPKNKLKVLNIVNNQELQYVNFSSNQLTTFDISNNKKVLYVNANSNKLTNLNLQNGLKSLYIDLDVPNYKNNPDLKCIQVTDATYAKSMWSYYADPNVRFSEDCAGPLVLLPNNFTVEAKGESCQGENNGAINITAKESFAYQAKINDKVVSFSNNTLSYPNLAPGNYTISITIPNEIFEQNFKVTIPKAATTTGKSNVTAKNVAVEITEGTAPFTVFVDGTEQFKTTDTNFTVALDKAGLVEVATAKACEGVYAKKVSSYELGTILAAYPNPTSGTIEIEIPNAKTEVSIELFNFGGQLVSKGNYNTESGKVLLNLEKLPSGIYAAKINSETPEYIKIIKN